MNNMFLSKEDYEEPCCPLSKPNQATHIPIGRIIEKLDEYLSRNDYSASERYLKYWLAEAEACCDDRGRLSVLNEQIGLYRKMGKMPEGLKAIDESIKLIDSLNMENTITQATTFINVATGYKAFGRAKDALPLYRKAQEIYESDLKPNDSRLGGLYNNLALVLMELGDYKEARELFNKAFDIMSKQINGETDMAITYCNLADLVAQELGMVEGEKQIADYLLKAQKLLETKSLPRDGYYAFVCEKCAPTFGYYGYFLVEQKLLKQAREIYERN